MIVQQFSYSGWDALWMSEFEKIMDQEQAVHVF